jgi:predicted nucleic acid-binding protein
MRQFYMDTNIYISALKPDDPYHTQCRVIMKALERDEIRAETSTLTLLEVASISGRLYAAKEQGKTQKERRVFIVRALRRLTGLKTKFVNVTGDTRSSIRGIETSLPSIFNDALLLSLRCTLKPLDLIHLAAAKHAKQVNSELGAFVTGDQGFLSNRRELSEIMKMPIFSPKEYLDGLGVGTREDTYN